VCWDHPLAFLLVAQHVDSGNHAPAAFGDRHDRVIAQAARQRQRQMGIFLAGIPQALCPQARILADAFPDANLAPAPADRADYYRWIFFTSGPVEAAFSNKAAGWEPTPERQRMFGYGNYDLAISNLERAVSANEYIAADHFTAADLFVGANVNFMLAFKLLEPRPPFVDYARRMTDRPAFRRAKEIDDGLIAQAQAAQPLPQPA
jgi:hypothetical protein